MGWCGTMGRFTRGRNRRKCVKVLADSEASRVQTMAEGRRGMNDRWLGSPRTVGHTSARIVHAPVCNGPSIPTQPCREKSAPGVRRPGLPLALFGSQLTPR